MCLGHHTEHRGRKQSINDAQKYDPILAAAIERTHFSDETEADDRSNDEEAMSDLVPDCDNNRVVAQVYF